MPLKVVAPNVLPLQRKVASDCLVDVDTNRYSVPHGFVGRKIEVLVHDGQVAIRCDGREIARHAQARGRHRVVEVREHYAGLWPQSEPAARDVEHVDAPLAQYEELA